MLFNPQIHVSPCPYVQRTSVCFKIETCQFCQPLLRYRRIMKAPQFVPVTKPIEEQKEVVQHTTTSETKPETKPETNPETKPKLAPLKPVDLDTYQCQNEVYKKVQIGGITTTLNYQAPKDMTQAFKQSQAFTKFPQNMEMKPESLDKENLTVEGSDGKRYSIAHLLNYPVPSTTTTPIINTAAPAAASHLPPQSTLQNQSPYYADQQDFESMMMDQYENTMDYNEESKNCSCCMGYVYNCQGMKNGDISCVDYCYCLAEAMHNDDMMNWLDYN